MPTAAPKSRRNRNAEAATPFRLEGHIFYYFSQILARRNRALNIDLRVFGLDYQRWRVMAVLNEEAGCSMLKLADHTSVDRTTLTRTLGLMQAEGLISRRERADDRRGVAISLTSHGRTMLKQILPLVHKHTARALAGFPPSEVEALRAQLERIVENLKR